mgnify:CR=1 FL=1
MEPSYEFDRYEHTTLLWALINYGMEVAHPEECIALLKRLQPEPLQPWETIMAEARESRRVLFTEATREELEVAAMRER